MAAVYHKPLDSRQKVRLPTTTFGGHTMCWDQIVEAETPRQQQDLAPRRALIPSINQPLRETILTVPEPEPELELLTRS